MAVTLDKIAAALGAAVPEADSIQAQQWNLWIDDALMLIQARVDSITPTPTIDDARVDYVVREAVVAHIRRPDNATQVTTSVDDGSVSKTYRSSGGRVGILDEWWRLLGLSPQSSGAFSIRPSCGSGAHMPWCNLAFGALYCSCGADLTNYEYPLYEGGVLSTGDYY